MSECGVTTTDRGPIRILTIDRPTRRNAMSTATAEALELAGAHGVTISMDIGRYYAGVRRRAAIYAVRATLQLDREARDRALTAARNLTVFFPEQQVRAVIRAAAEGSPRART